MDREKKAARGRRIARAVACVLLLGVAWLAGFALQMEVESRAYYAERQEYETALAEYDKRFDTYCVAVRKAMGLDSEGWVDAAVSIKSEIIDENGSVGNELGMLTLIGDTYTAAQMGTVKVQVLANNEITTWLTERDDKNVDIGSKTGWLWIEPGALNIGITYEQDVTLTEDKGRYAGSFLAVRVTYTIVAETPLDVSEAIKIVRPVKPSDPGEGKRDWWWIRMGVVCTVALVLLLWYIIGWCSDDKTLKMQKAAELAEKEAKIREMREIYKDTTPRERAGVPNGVKFDEWMQPFDRYEGRVYGNYSVYITYTGRVYHAQEGCCGAKREIHLFTAIRDRGLHPCAKCAAGYPYKIPEWFDDYCELRRELQRYELDEELGDD